MNGVKFTYPNGLKKALTFSYDDGVYQDLKLIDIFNRYGLRCTFNVNSGVEANSKWDIKGTNVYRVDLKRTKEFYDSHEMAVHTLTHPDLSKLASEEIKNEILGDKNNLEIICNKTVSGMAYPYGIYNDNIIRIMKDVGINYCRTVESTYKFDIPSDFLKWSPTCHHNSPKLMQLADDFINNSNNSLELFYVWGHSYEFDINNNWGVMDKFAEYISDKGYIWYATNIEIYEYITALKQVNILDEGNLIYNNSNLDIYAEFKNEIVCIRSKEVLNITV